MPGPLQRQQLEKDRHPETCSCWKKESLGRSEVWWGAVGECLIKMLMEYLTWRPNEPWVEVREVFPAEVAIEVRSEGGLKGVMGWYGCYIFKEHRWEELCVSWVMRQRSDDHREEFGGAPSLPPPPPPCLSWSLRPAEGRWGRSEFTEYWRKRTRVYSACTLWSLSH